jgi:purine-cytosine permease-like protein
MPLWLWILLAVLCLTALVVLGFATLRKGHTALFWFGILFPFLWIVGALMGPTPAAEARISNPIMEGADQ